MCKINISKIQKKLIANEGEKSSFYKYVKRTYIVYKEIRFGTTIRRGPIWKEFRRFFLDFVSEQTI